MMKFLIVCFVILGSYKSYGQSTVYDRGKNRQLESMVITKWSKRHFRPKWYYKLVHNKYRKGPDRRLIWQLSPTLLLDRASANKTEEEKGFVDKDFDDEMLEHFDKTVNTKYDLLYKDVINELYINMNSLDIQNSLTALEEYENNNLIISEHYENVEIFRERQKNIKDVYRPSFEKNSEYNLLIKDMREYVALLYNIKERLKVVNKYKEYFINQEIDN